MEERPTQRIQMGGEPPRPGSRALVVAVVLLALVLFLILGLLAGLFALRYLQREPVELTISPTSAQVETLGVVQFRAEVRGAEDEVIWYVNEVEGGEATNGTISSNGLYRAPSEVPSGPVLVKAVARADETRSAQAQVTVVAAEVAEEETAPEAATIEEAIPGEATPEEGTPEEATPEEGTPDEATRPTISLTQIYGPDYVEDGCIYRFRAEVTGNPTPTIEFNRDDSDGAWGNDVAQVGVPAFESFTLEAIATNSAGSDTASVEVSCAREEPVNHPPTVTLTLSEEHPLPDRSITVTAVGRDPDGDILEYRWEVSGGSFADGARVVEWSRDSDVAPRSDTGGDYTVTVTVRDGRGGTDSESITVNVSPPVREANLRVVWDETGFITQGGSVFNDSVFVGDNVPNEYITGYISFDITSLSGKTVQSIRFAMSSVTQYGDRSSFGNLWIGTLDYGRGPLQASDRDIPAQHLATFPNSVTAISYDGEGIGFSGQSMKIALQSRIDAGNPRFQLKVYWSHPGSNGNGASDGLGYLVGNISLRVEYTD